MATRKSIQQVDARIKTCPDCGDSLIDGHCPNPHFCDWIEIKVPAPENPLSPCQSLATP